MEPTKEDVVNYNIHLKEKSYSLRNTSLSAIKAFFILHMETPLQGIANIRPPKEKKKPKVYDCDILALKLRYLSLS